MSASNGWAKPVPLGELLTKNDRTTAIEADETYREVTIKLWGKGVIERRTTTGSEIAAARRSVVKAGDFILSRIDARNGAMGIIPPELDGAVVSNDFPSFATIEDRLLPEYLGWLSKTRGFVDACRRASEGTTNRVRLKEEKFLNQTIPLPPISEQRRIVVKIERLAGKIAEATLLSTQSDSLSDGLLKSVYRSMVEKSARRPLSDVAPLERRPAEVTPDGVYPGVSVRSFGRGCFHNPPLYGSSITWQKPHLVREGDILVSNIKAWEGAIAVARPEDDGRYGSHRYLTFRPVDRVATARFLAFHLLSEEGLYDVGMASPGSADRNRTLRSKEMLAIEVPVPSYEEQLRFDAMIEQREELARKRERTRRELAAILPSVLDRAFRGELDFDLPEKRNGASATDQQLAKRAMFYVAMLLRHWNKPVARNVIDACLVLMLNDQARKKILGNDSFQASSADGSNPPPHGMDSLLGQMRARKVVKITTQNEQQFLELGEQAPSTNSVTTADRERLEESIAAFEIVGEDRAASVLAEMIDTTYELAAT